MEFIILASKKFIMIGVKDMEHRRMYINGAWVNASTGKTYSLTNPATQKVIASAAYGGGAEAHEAINSAFNAFPTWSGLTAKERSTFLLKLYQLMKRDKETIAQLITLEMGKPIREARGEVDLAAEYLLWNAEESKRIYGEIIPASAPNKRLNVIKQPIGPVAAITPWNFPISMVTRKIAPALAAGCTVILKPASNTPGSVCRLFELIDEIGFPPGVANLVIGNSKEIGNAFLNDHRIKKITFTGSTDVGKKLLEGAAKQVKRVSMELGGHAPFIVFEDADLEKAAEGAIISKYRNAGQTCICLNRLYVQSSIKNQFETIIAQKIKQLKIGNGMEETTELGPLVDQGALIKVQSQVEDALNKGAKLVTGGKLVEGLGGLFYEPTLLSDVTNEMIITTEETFGPVAPIYTFDTEDEVIKQANNTQFGLSAYFYTKDLARAYRVSEKLEYGIIGINDPVPTTVQAPFGGMKESGIGREGGHQGVSEYVEEKFISISL